MNISAIVLAAGQGKRMKSRLYKVLHPVCGVPMVGHVVQNLSQCKVNRKVVVVGHGADAVKSYLGDQVEYVFQHEQLGTGHAVLQAQSLLANEQGVTIVICGDTPLIRSETLQQMVKLHVESYAGATILTAQLDNPVGYGRIIRNDLQHVTAIVEQKDCNSAQQQIREINTGTYCFDTQKLFQALSQVTNHNHQQEYYLTDVISILATQQDKIQGYCLEDAEESIGVNDRVALAEADQMMRRRINFEWMRNGVTFIDPKSTYIEASVKIGMDTVVYPNTSLRGNTSIGENCQLGPNTEIVDSTIGDEVQIKYSVLQGATVGDHSQIGPFAYLRPGAKLANHVKIGDFVEIKNASIDEGSKVSHLSYIGDAEIGKHVNFGCGAITVNYDGYHKHVTHIQDGAFIGSNVNLIAPVKIGSGAYVVAGSTITHNVEADDVAIARQRQSNKSGYAKILRDRIQKN